MAPRDCVPPRFPVAMGSYHESLDRRQFARIFGSISQPLMPGMLMSARIRLSKASAMTLRRYVDLKILHYRFGPEDHPHPIRNLGQVFFGELSRFLLPKFEESIKFTVHPAAYCVQADLVEKKCRYGIGK